MNFFELKGKEIRVSHYERDIKGNEYANVFVKNLDKSISNKELFQLFKQFGEIKSSKIATDVDTYQSKGYGFVQYRTKEAAEKAIVEVNLPYSILFLKSRG